MLMSEQAEGALDVEVAESVGWVEHLTLEYFDKQTDGTYVKKHRPFPVKLMQTVLKVLADNSLRIDDTQRIAITSLTNRDGGKAAQSVAASMHNTSSQVSTCQSCSPQ